MFTAHLPMIDRVLSNLEDLFIIIATGISKRFQELSCGCWIVHVHTKESQGVDNSFRTVCDFCFIISASLATVFVRNLRVILGFAANVMVILTDILR